MFGRTAIIVGLILRSGVSLCWVGGERLCAVLGEGRDCGCVSVFLFV